MSDGQAARVGWASEEDLPLPRVVHVVQAADSGRAAGMAFDGRPWITDGPEGAVVYDLGAPDVKRLLHEAPQRVFQIKFDPLFGDLVIRLLRRDQCLDTFIAIGPGGPRLTEPERARLRDRVASRFGISPAFFTLLDQLN